MLNNHGKYCRLVSVLSLGLLALTAARAQPVHHTAQPYIMAGTFAPRTGWAVLVVNNGGIDGCTGVALSPTYVLTAKHCLTDPSIKSIAVHYSTQNHNIPKKTGIAVDMRHIYTPEGTENPTFIKDADLAILKLTVPHKLQTYAPVRFDYSANEGDTAIIYGYGDHDNVRSLEVHDKPLYQATMKIQGQPSTQILVKAGDGSTSPGDSGGPLMVGGKIVGILWGGDKNPTPHSTVIYNAFNHPSFGTLKRWFETVLKPESLSQ